MISNSNFNICTLLKTWENQFSDDGTGVTIPAYFGPTDSKMEPRRLCYFICYSNFNMISQLSIGSGIIIELVKQKP